MSGAAPSLRERLDEQIARAGVIYLAKAQELDGLLGFWGRRHPCSAGDMLRWTLGITHELSEAITRSHAIAWGNQQLITYGAPYLRRLPVHEWATNGLDLVLHEMGHLWCSHFIQRGALIGHGHEWQRVGQVVGYVPVGGTSERNRKLWMMEAAARRGLDV